jgi:hypothetical protein
MNKIPTVPLHREILQPCFLCGKRPVREDVDKYYYFMGTLVCSDHPYAKEWYEASFKMVNQQLEAEGVFPKD